MQTTIWRIVCKLRDPVYPSLRLALFHSTPTSSAKWKGKFDFDKDEGRGKQPSKNYIKYVVRRKRADAKRALNDFLLKGAECKRSVQDEWATWFADTKRSAYGKVEDISDDFYDHAQSNNSGRCKPDKSSSKKPKQNGTKPKKKWSFVSEDDERHSETTFEATFGNKHYTWSFRSWDGSDFRSSTTGFKWRDPPNWAKTGRESWGPGEKEQSSSWSSDRRRTWECESDFDDDNDTEPCITGSSSHRVTLGLPATGPLSIDDVKTAFRASALKWHPDKHRGHSQAMAGEKFKSCVEAYKSLCSALSSA